LALGIVAARAAARPTLPLPVISEELSTVSARVDAFDTGDPQTSLRAAFNASYYALDSDTARVFRLVGQAPDPTSGWRRRPLSPNAPSPRLVPTCALWSTRTSCSKP